jgi:antirestriction protein ArdC
VLDRLNDGLRALGSSECWRSWLEVQSRFHHYSFMNTVLIRSQCPEATYVAGFRAWKAIGRHVRTGEAGIRILAPVIRSRQQGVGSNSEEGEALVGFRAVSVFNFAQTDGRPLPAPVSLLRGADEADLYGRLCRIATAMGFLVELARFPDERNGDCDFRERRIRIRSANDPAQRAKTLAHEIAHAALHIDVDDRALAELEAESVAFIVCANSGLPSGSYSFGYVASWAGGTDDAINAIKVVGGRIQRTAEQILRDLETTEADSQRLG